MNELLRTIPKVDELLGHPSLKSISSPSLLKQAARNVLDRLRQDIITGAADSVPDLNELAKAAERLYMLSRRPSLMRVINGTGIILHTNLGRAPLANEALAAVNEAARGYSNLEYSTGEGIRGSRFSHVERLLTELTGAEAAMVVNNNAAAVMLALSAVFREEKRDVIVSRGELVEIGGSFRVPDVLTRSGCVLREVGATNKTHIGDYKNAITESTGALLRVHTSNFAIVGFTSKPSLAELAKLGSENDIPLVEDLGSGCLIDLSPYGIRNQPTVPDSVKAGADIITFSGDKLLGGPQAGIIVGMEKYLSEMKKHPLARAVRIDKLCLAALESTLRLYRDDPVKHIPTLRMICAPVEEIYEKAAELAEIIKNTGTEAGIVKCESQVGGGAMPGECLPSFGVAVTMSGMTANETERHFRTGMPPVIGRIADNQFLLDVRTIEREDFHETAKRCIL